MHSCGVSFSGTTFPPQLQWTLKRLQVKLTFVCITFNTCNIDKKKSTGRYFIEKQHHYFVQTWQLLLMVKIQVKLMCHILLNFWRNTLLKVTIIQWYSVVVHYGMKYTQEDICNIHVKKDWKKPVTFLIESRSYHQSWRSNSISPSFRKLISMTTIFTNTHPFLHHYINFMLAYNPRNFYIFLQ